MRTLVAFLVVFLGSSVELPASRHDEHVGIKTGVPHTPPAPPPPPPPLVPFKDAAPPDLLVGSAFNANRVWAVANESNDELQRYEAMFLKHFNLLTPANVCKMAVIKPTRDGPLNFAPCERVLNFAEENNLAVRFHALAWGNSSALGPEEARFGNTAFPPWVLELTNEEKPNILLQYVADVLARFGNRTSIKFWDVINEPVCDKSPFAPFVPQPSLLDNCEFEDSYLKPSAWVPSVPGGEAPPWAYVDGLFGLADELLPPGRGKLVLNEYLAESDLTPEDPFKARRLISVVEAALQRGVPIDAVGLQFHVSIWHAGEGLIGRALFRSWRANIAKIFAEFQRLGVHIHVTELDVGCNFATLPCPSFISRRVQRQLQAIVFRDVARACLESPVCNVLSLWGFTDRFSWRSAPPGAPANLNQRAHPFSEEYEAKPAAFAFSQALLAGRT